MSDNTFDNNIDSGEFKLVDILAEFSGDNQVETPEDMVFESESHAIKSEKSESFAFNKIANSLQGPENCSPKDSTLDSESFAFTSCFTSDEIVEELAHSGDEAFELDEDADVKIYETGKEYASDLDLPLIFGSPSNEESKSNEDKIFEEAKKEAEVQEKDDDSPKDELSSPEQEENENFEDEIPTDGIKVEAEAESSENSTASDSDDEEDGSCEDESPLFHFIDKEGTSSDSTEDKVSDETSKGEKISSDGNEDPIWSSCREEKSESKSSEYAPKEEYPQPKEQEKDKIEFNFDFKEKILVPILTLLAAVSEKIEQRREKEKQLKIKEAQHLPPELSPARSAAFYSSQSGSLHSRLILSALLTVILVWLSYGFPAFGVLGHSIIVRSYICLVLELTVTLIGLDIFTNGIMSAVRFRPGAETLVSLSCIVSALDAVVNIASKNVEVGLPYCGVSALSMTFAIWGSYLSCEGFAISMKTVAKARDPFTVTSKIGSDAGEGSVLSKSKRSVTGFVRQSEQADVFETIYHLACPILVAASFILSLFFVIISKENNEFLHTFAACIAVSCSLSAFIGFPLPFYIMSKRLSRSGAAIAGYVGCAQMGQISRVMISDSDVFPPRTISFADISISQEFDPKTVISYAGSMVIAGGLGTAPIFKELMEKNKCHMSSVEDFSCHEGGGIIAKINGETVYVGCAGFMRLMGIRVSKKAVGRSTIYIAIENTLAGIFNINYKPVGSVQRALVSLLRKGVEPVFAVRDFLVTPMLINQKFRMPKQGYDFPSFAERYRMSSQDAEDNASICAIFSRGSLNAVAGLTERGRRLYKGAALCAALSVLGGVIGIILMLFLSRTGSFESASVGNVISYMLLWLVPSLLLSYNMRA